MRLHAQHRHLSRARITIMNTANHRRNPVERDLTEPLRRQIGALLIRDAEWRRPHLAPQIDGDEYLSGTGVLAQECGTKHLLSRACHTTIQEVLSSSLPGNVHNAPHLPKLMGKMNAPRQTRASRPKVKTGCNNCKLRRIKCDETRPQCLKCVKAKKQCGGYPVFKRPADLALPPIAPAPPTRNVSDVSLFHPSRTGLSPKSRNRANLNKSHQCQSLTFSPQESVAFSPNPWDMQVNRGSFDQLEGQYFQVFRIHTASELSGFFDSDFWTRSVLVESHSEASVRHAVIALGALYKTLDNAAECRQKSMSSCSLSTRNHYNYALQQYGKSIKHLRESLAAEETRSPRTMLISIIIFTCIQSFTGDHGDAIAHIQTGLRLIEEWGPSSHEPDLIQIFTRLTIQAKSYDMAFHLPNPIRLSPRNESVRSMGQISPKSTVSDIGSSVAGGSLHIPDRFHSAKEARPALDYITQSILRLMESLSSFHPGPNNILPRRVKNYCNEFGVQLDRWGLAFEPLVINARHDVNISDTEKAGIFVLKMFFNMTYVLFFMSFSTTEMDFDNFTPQFDEIVDVANEISIQQSFQSSPEQLPGPFPNLVNMIGNQDNYCKIKASFALELGIVPPLYVVATKCRIRRLRREAIRLLLSSPRREGMWDSLLCGHLAQWIMDIEEEDLPPWNGELDSVSSQYVPTYDKRVMVKGVFFNLQNHEATIRCGHRAKGDGDLDTRIRSTKICW